MQPGHTSKQAPEIRGTVPIQANRPSESDPLPSA